MESPLFEVILLYFLICNKDNLVRIVSGLAIQYLEMFMNRQATYSQESGAEAFDQPKVH